MVLEASMTTTTSSKIKALLLQAWRERWNEVEFGRNIKRLLPRGVSGDVYNLAEAILRQAVSGPVPNALMMTYLEHCLGAQVISFGTVIQTITEVQEDTSNAACSLCLLQFLQKFITRTSCYGNEDECIALCCALVSLLSWLFRVISNSIDELTVASATSFTDGSNGAISYLHMPIIKLAAEILTVIAKSSFLKALLYIGKLEEPAVWRSFMTDYNLVSPKISLLSDRSVPESLHYVVSNFLKNIEWLNVSSSEAEGSPSTTSSSPTIEVAINQLTSYSTYVPYRLLAIRSLQSAIAFSALLERFDNAEVLASQILIISRYFNISMPQIYCESLHATFLSLIEGQKISEKVDTPNVSVFHKWSSFFLMKLPQVFKCLAAQSSSSSLADSDVHFEAGLELLKLRTPLLELFTSNDLHCKEFLPKFFSEVEKLCLCNARTSESFMKFVKAPKVALSSEKPPPSQSVVIRAEAILKLVFSVADDQDRILPGLLCQMHNSLEILLCVTSCTGSLSQLAQKVLKLNEQHKESPGENISKSQTRLVYFDISFLILCSLTINFGSEVLLNDPLTADSFFARWVVLNFTEKLSPEAIFEPVPEKEKTKVNKLIDALLLATTSGAELYEPLVKCPSIVNAVQVAVDELLKAWGHGVIGKDVIDFFIERVKSKVLFASVVAFCMLVSKLRVAGEEEREKIMYMLTQLYIPYNFEEAEKENSPNADSSATPSGPDDSNNFFYRERGLVLRIVNRQLYNKFLPDFEPPKIDDKPPKFNYTGNALRLSRDSLNDLLKKTLDATKSHFTMENIHDFDKLVVMGGLRWFTNAVVEMLFDLQPTQTQHQQQPDEIVRLQRAVDMAYGLFHLDLEQCALVLLRETIPRLLLFRNAAHQQAGMSTSTTTNQDQHQQLQQSISEPRVSALLRLTLMTTFGAISHVQVLSKSGRPRRSDHRLEYGEYFNEWQLRNFTPEMIEGTAYAYELRDGGSGGRRSSRKMGNGLNGAAAANNSDDDVIEVPMDVDKHGVLEELLDDGCGDLLREPLYAEFVRFLKLVLELSLEHNSGSGSGNSSSASTAGPCCWSMVSLSVLEQILLCLRGEAREFLQFVPFHSLDAIVRANYDVLTFEQLLAYLCLDGSSRARKAAARLLCQLHMSKAHCF